MPKPTSPRWTRRPWTPRRSSGWSRPRRSNPNRPVLPGEPMSLLTQEPAVRVGCFAGVLAVMAAWQALAPRRRLTTAKPARWASNLGLVVLDTVAVRLLLPVGVVGVALLAEERGWGVFNHLGLPAWLAVALAVVALDLAIYLQHVLFHAVPVLWRFVPGPPPPPRFHLAPPARVP